MSSFVGDVLLLVNVASYWGYTKDYDQLPKLFDAYSDQGFKILAFPCNQFAAEEPGTHGEILEFVKQYDARMAQKLVFFEKADVNGSKARQVYSFLQQAIPAQDGSTAIGWNFEKFLVDHTGTPVLRFSPDTSPFAIRADIEELLRKKQG